MNIEVGSVWRVKCEPSETLKVLVSGQAVTYEFEDYSGEVIAETLIKEDFLKRFEPVKQDMVNHPRHYKQGSVECIEAIKAALTPEEFRGYCKGNIIKYTWRESHKGSDESLQKADWYLGQLLDD